MSDSFDELMRAAANQADRGVDYDAMRASVLKKAEAERKRLRTNVIRYGSIAAAAAIVVVAGTVLISRGGLASPRSAESPALDDTAMYATGGYENGVESFAAEEPSTEESAAEESPAVGSADSASGATAPEAGLGSTQNGGDPTQVTPDLPELCGSSCTGLYWEEGEVELPGVYFGGEQNVVSDASGLTCTVAGCTEDEYNGYVGTVMDWYPADESTADETSAPGYPRVFTRLTTFGCQIRVEYAKDGTMTVSAKNIG